MRPITEIFKIVVLSFYHDSARIFEPSSLKVNLNGFRQIITTVIRFGAFGFVFQNKTVSKIGHIHIQCLAHIVFCHWHIRSPRSLNKARIVIDFVHNLTVILILKPVD